MPRRGAIFALTDDSVLITPFGKDARSSLISMRDADLEGVVVEARDQSGGAALVLLLEKAEQAVAVIEAVVRFVHHTLSVTDGVIQELDLEAASVAALAGGKGEEAKSTVAIEAKCIFEKGAAGVVGAARVVGDGDFFPGSDGADCVDGFAVRFAVPAMMGVGETAVVDEANGWVDSANLRTGAAGKGICFDGSAEWVLAREVVVKGKELS